MCASARGFPADDETTIRDTAASICGPTSDVMSARASEALSGASVKRVSEASGPATGSDDTVPTRRSPLPFRRAGNHRKNDLAGGIHQVHVVDEKKRRRAGGRVNEIENLRGHHLNLTSPARGLQEASRQPHGRRVGEGGDDGRQARQRNARLGRVDPNPEHLGVDRVPPRWRARWSFPFPARRRAGGHPPAAVSARSLIRAIASARIIGRPGSAGANWPESVGLFEELRLGMRRFSRMRIHLMPRFGSR